ncbi:hypothetical protein AVU38_gp155 [Ralstonia phage RSL2]|uniref:Uncharacterized protein n=1 Tax=Ralstonia phage RSL2 TaxID=1585840 RepID=A0A0A8J9F5_9CAUD|nr:hypothetical protein AVU38_gp155 [Ralstonia phage RSL2]BAQ02683.1 hypothetical protein [Ralstonia phage RSL2]
MSKLQRTVEGQTIQFLPLPKIFNALSADLPSGAVNLSNGEVAYWRLNRNLAELKKHRKNMKDLTAKLASALNALVNSDSFKNHYGILEAPALPSDSQLVTLFRNLLQLNTNRVDYSSIHHGRNKPLVETIQVPLGNMVFFNAIRGVQDGPKVEGIKGKLWLKEGSDTDQAFEFTIISPVVQLADFIGPDRLEQEVLSKLKQNLPALVFNPKLVFKPGQFKNYVGAGLQALGEKFNNGQQNGSGKKKEKAKKEQPTPPNPASEIEQPLSVAEKVDAVRAGDLDQLDAETAREISAQARAQVSVQLDENDPAPEQTVEKVAEEVNASVSYASAKGVLGEYVLTKAEFEALSLEQKGVYLAVVEKQCGDESKWPLVRGVLNSGILEGEYNRLNETLEPGEKISHPLYIARVIFQLTNDQFAKITGEFNALEKA